MKGLYTPKHFLGGFQTSSPKKVGGTSFWRLMLFVARAVKEKMRCYLNYAIESILKHMNRIKHSLSITKVENINVLNRQTCLEI